MTRALALRPDAAVKVALAAAVLAVSLAFMPAPAHAAALTEDQVQGVLGFLSAFNVPQATVDDVRATLAASVVEAGDEAPAEAPAKARPEAPAPAGAADARTVLARTDHFAFSKAVVPGMGVAYTLSLLDGRGQEVATASNPGALRALIGENGLDASELMDLQGQLDAAGFNLSAAASWPRNFLPGVSTAPIDAAAGLAAVGIIPIQASADSLNLLADEVMKVNWSLTNVVSAYLALFELPVPQASAAAVASASMTTSASDISFVTTLSYLPSSAYETMSGVTSFMAAVEMAPLYVITDALSDSLYRAGLY